MKKLVYLLISPLLAVLSQGLEMSLDETSTLIQCTLVEMHALAVAIVEGTDMDADIPEEFECHCDDGITVYDVVSGSVSETDNIVDTHFNGEYPNLGITQLRVPSQALIERPSRVRRAIDLSRVNQRDLLLLEKTSRTRSLRETADVTRGVYTIAVIRVTTGDDSVTRSRNQLASDVFGLAYYDRNNLVSDVLKMRSEFGKHFVPTHFTYL